MARKVEFVELFAGMAAVTWRLAGGVPPVSYQGGKRRQAPQILAAMALRSEDISHVVLVERDPLVAGVLRLAFDRSRHADALATWAAWAEPEAEQKERYTRFVGEGFGGLGEHDAAVRWLWLRNRTVIQVPVDRARPCDWAQRQCASKTRWTLDTPALGLSRLPAAPWPVVVLTGDAVNYQPHPGALVYADPPYAGTNGYSVELEEPAEAIAQRWADAGSPAYVSEGRPVPGGVPIRIQGRERAPGQQIGKKGHVEEWLTAFQPGERLAGTASAARRAETVTFVELFAGMAAVTWALAGGAPPVGYQGGKRRQAPQIIAAMGLRAAHIDRVVLVERDPLVAGVLRLAFDRSRHADALATWAAWAEPEAAQKERYTRFVGEGFGGLGEHDAAVGWLWLRNRTVIQVPVDKARPCDWKQRRFPNGANAAWSLATPTNGLSRLPAAPWPVVVLTGDAVDYQPHPGALVYADPPYAGTNGYAAGLGEPVEAIAQRWADAGSRAYVSEGRPVPGGVPIRIQGRERSPGQQIGKKGHVEEWLTVFQPGERLAGTASASSTLPAPGKPPR